MTILVVLVALYFIIVGLSNYMKREREKELSPFKRINVTELPQSPIKDREFETQDKNSLVDKIPEIPIYGDRISAAEYEKQGHLYTSQVLKELQQFIDSNPSVYNKLQPPIPDIKQRASVIIIDFIMITLFDYILRLILEMGVELTCTENKCTRTLVESKVGSFITVDLDSYPYFYRILFIEEEELGLMIAYLIYQLFCYIVSKFSSNELQQTLGQRLLGVQYLDQESFSNYRVTWYARLIAGIQCCSLKLLACDLFCGIVYIVVGYFMNRKESENFRKWRIMMISWVVAGVLTVREKVYGGKNSGKVS